MSKPIPDHIMARAEVVAKEATRDAMRDPLMPYYITVAPHIARAILAAVEEEREDIVAIAEGERVAWSSAEYFGGFNDACNAIASAIRARKGN